MQIASFTRPRVHGSAPDDMANCTNVHRTDAHLLREAASTALWPRSRCCRHLRAEYRDAAPPWSRRLAPIVDARSGLTDRTPVSALKRSSCESIDMPDGQPLPNGAPSDEQRGGTSVVGSADDDHFHRFCADAAGRNLILTDVAPGQEFARNELKGPFGEGSGQRAFST